MSPATSSENATAVSFDPGAVDFSTVKEGFELIPTGKWEAELTGVEFGTSKTGNPKAKLTFTITEEGEYSGRKAWADLPLQPKTLWKVKKWLVSLGADPDDLAGQQVNLRDVFGSVNGRLCVLSLGMHTYQGEGDAEPREFQDVLDVLPYEG